MSIFSKLFGTTKKDFTYGGPKPVSSLSGVQGGKEYYQTILDRMYGRNVGFGPEYANQYANPIIKNSRNQFESYQIPELKSELSATGRRRGSGGFDQLRRAYQEQGLAEGEIFSNLQQRNEDQMRNEINDAVGRVGDYAKNEAELQNRAANFEYDKIYAPQVQREQQRQANEAQGYQRILQGITDFASPYLSSMSFASKMVAPTSASYASTSSIPGYINALNSAYPNTSGYGKSGRNLSQRLAQRYMRG